MLNSKLIKENSSILVDFKQEWALSLYYRYLNLLLVFR